MMVWAIFSIFLMYSCSGTTTYFAKRKGITNETRPLDLELKLLINNEFYEYSSVKNGDCNGCRTQRGVKKYAGMLKVAM